MRERERERTRGGEEGGASGDRKPDGGRTRSRSGAADDSATRWLLAASGQPLRAVIRCPTREQPLGPASDSRSMEAASDIQRRAEPVCGGEQDATISCMRGGNSGELCRPPFPGSLPGRFPGPLPARACARRARRWRRGRPEIRRRSRPRGGRPSGAQKQRLPVSFGGRFAGCWCGNRGVVAARGERSGRAARRLATLPPCRPYRPRGPREERGTC